MKALNAIVCFAALILLHLKPPFTARQPAAMHRLLFVAATTFVACASLSDALISNTSGPQKPGRSYSRQNIKTDKAMSPQAVEIESTSNEAHCSSSRRNCLRMSLLAAAAVFVDPSSQAYAAEGGTTFRSQAFDLKEYTNSITASKDTNVSPKEAYDVLAETIQPLAGKASAGGASNRNRALDVGAGAGVSTQTLYEMGFTNMDAVDWSGTAWNDNVVECPPSVTFYEMDDERFFASQQKDLRKYQVIVYNFAINLDKAVRVAKEHLDPALENARLLVPANAQKDYWYKQTYYLIDVKGDVVWKSKADVGAWSVQFQPDVTSDTCQGPWCPPYNGFVKRR